MINDDHTSTGHRPGERHLSGRHREDALAGSSRDVDATVTGAINMVGWRERSGDRRHRVQRPDPGWPGAASILGVGRRGRQQQAQACEDESDKCPSDEVHPSSVSGSARRGQQWRERCGHRRRGSVLWIAGASSASSNSSPPSSTLTLRSVCTGRLRTPTDHGQPWVRASVPVTGCRCRTASSQVGIHVGVRVSTSRHTTGLRRSASRRRCSQRAP